MQSKGPAIWKDRLSRFFRWQASSIIAMLVIYAAFVACVNPVFISIDNIINIFRSMGFPLMVVIGMTFVLITGGLDLSVGSVLALGGIICGLSMSAGIPVPLSILIGVASGSLAGFFIGGIIVYTGIPPLIVTLGMQYVCRGIVQVLTKGAPIYPLPAGFNAIEPTKLFGVLPLIVVISLFIAAIGHVTLSHTVFGRSIYAIGGNEEAAKISGIRIARTKIMVYVITSTLAALCGVFVASRLGSSEAAAGTGFELKVICGAIIGGTSTFGGMGTILGATLGALFMEIMTNSLTLMRISVYWQNLVFGIVLMASVLLDQYKRKLILRQSVKARN